MNQFDIDFDGLRAQALNTTLLNEQRSEVAGKRPPHHGIAGRLTLALRTIASLWNRRQRPLPDYIARSRDRMINAAQL